MPSKTTMDRARKAKAEGKAPTTQAGEFVKEEMEHVKRGKHGVRSRKQAVAIGLSKARRAGVKLPARGKGGGGRGSAGARSAGKKNGARRSAGGRKTGTARKRAR